MTPLTMAKLILAVAGIAIYFYGWNSALPPLRWIGIALVAAGVLLRFLPRPKGPDREGPNTPS
jgi:drug/metabolite transporter (DMT)-like permease